MFPKKAKSHSLNLFPVAKVSVLLPLTDLLKGLTFFGFIILFTFQRKLLETHYKLLSPVSGSFFEDENWLLDISNESAPCLLRSVYQAKQLNLKGDELGIYRFSDWLPIKRLLKGSSSPVTYKSEKLAHVLGLKNLYITFSGWFPEKGASMKTCSFKETEAYTVCARMDERFDKVLVVASAGNTARAFASVCSKNNIPLLLCVPEDNLDALWFDEPIRDCVKLIATKTGSDYYDAIHLSNLAVKTEGFLAEGGAKNVARRDGMATTLLSAATHIGKIPEYYFQAVGSGTGAIAAWEANLRLIDDGRFGNHKMKLMLSQNEPFHPIYDAWKALSRDILPMDDEEARIKANLICAKVLSNRKPPYSLTGGLFDALKDTEGDLLLASNLEAGQAAELFEQTEGIDIHPAAAVATATLQKAVSEGRIHPEAIIMLNITGGGEKRFKQGKPLHDLKPDHIFEISASQEEVSQKLKKLFAKA